VKTIISANSITLDLPIHTIRRKPRARQVTVREVGGRLEQQDPTHARVRALSEVSFEIQQGDRVGLIGHNGAGKSSLLKVLAGIYPPSAGQLRVEGSISTLFTNNIGFNQNATGYENIILMGILLGYGRKRMLQLLPEIAEYSELGDFLEMPVRTYSMGMRTRLGFAIATSVQPECLLIDEVLGAGDARFQRKAKKRLTTMMENAYTYILASHSTNTIESLCDRALWLDHGQLRSFGPVAEVIGEFNADNDSPDAN